MEIRVLAIGDVTGKSGVGVLVKHLKSIQSAMNIDFTVVNGENADMIGVKPQQVRQIIEAGADVVTLGNHTFRKADIIPLLDEEYRLLRPSNYAPQAPGRGYGIYNLNGPSILVVSLIGRVFMDVGPDNPFFEIDRILKRTTADVKLVDFHAEATSEKLAMANYLDGRVSAVWGTHTHVQTSDECVLSGGTGYITDIGTTGPRNSVLGVAPAQSISRFLGNPPEFYKCAEGPCKVEGAVFTVSTLTGLCRTVERVRVDD